MSSTITVASQERITIFRIYNYYRVILGFLLFILFVEGFGIRVTGSFRPDLFLNLSVIYIISNIVISITSLIPTGKYQHNIASTLTIFLLDILFLVLITYASGGAKTGVANLLIITMAFAAALIPARLAIALPAVSIILVLFQEFYLSLLVDSPPQSFFQAGLLGILLFALFILVQRLTERMRSGEDLAARRAIDVDHLEHLNQSILERLPSGTVVSDINGLIKQINPAAKRLMGYDDTTNQDENSIPNSLKVALQKWQGNPRAETKSFSLGKGEITPQFTQLEDDILITLQDKAELNAKAQQLKLAGLGQMAASISHEIRNPLGAISHAAQLLAESENLDKYDTRLITMVQDHCLRMNGIIQNILQLSKRTESNALQLDLDTWLTQFIASFTEQSPETKITLTTGGDKVIANIDPTQISQVLTNLIENGLRYSEMATGKLTIEVILSLENQQPTIEIVDQGTGVGEDMIHRLFEPFYTTENSGTGLGLYLSKELCEANHAHLEYISRDQAGACFKITFPLETQKQEITI